MEHGKKPFTGRERIRKNRSSVAISNTVARTLITVGGIGTILSVLLVCVFLIVVTAPLFLPGSISESTTVAVEGKDEEALASTEIKIIGVDEYQSVVWTLNADMRVRAVSLADGQLIEDRPLLDDGDGPRITAIAASPTDASIVIGLSDGTARLGEIGFTTTFLERSDVSDEIRRLEVGAFATAGRSVIERTPEGQFRQQQLAIRFDEPLEILDREAVRLVDFVQGGSGPVIAALGDNRILQLVAIRTRQNLLTGEKTINYDRGQVPLESEPGRGLPDWMLLSGLGDSVSLTWRDGLLHRYDTRARSNMRRVEERSLHEGSDEDATEIASVTHLLGKRTILVGESTGEVSAWFTAKPENAATLDGRVLVRAHEFHHHDAAVTSVASSARSRLIAVGFEDGHLEIRHVTSNKRIISVDTEDGKPVLAVSIAPKENAVLAVSRDSVYKWDFDVGHPEVTLASLFLPVWYEGAAEAAQVWQSSAGSDEFEPKLGLMPLVFGTVKATVYAMLFGVPIAILAAIYTSEFLHPRIRAGVKPFVEMMASLPSVVLGFIAAIIVAPFVEEFVPAMLALFLLIPCCFLIGAYLWQLIPYQVSLRAAPYRLIFILFTFPVAFTLAVAAGPVLESIFFAGDIRIWLSGQIGSGAPAWMFLLLPISLIITLIINAQVINPAFRRVSAEWTRSKAAYADLAKFGLNIVLTFAIATVASVLLNELAYDPRGTFVGTYVQRNALIVGFIMGFAIIPIIYTIADDALSAVPEHLRSASLGAGATPWQTAVRIIVPTAMSGLFSACMIGLGRAVGETMIVLMAAGNTPLMDWNVFSGMRTLSANIAVELPEAVRNSTHYRTLFFAALVLFAMTFVINTIAESVRVRFRKRAFEL